MNLYRTFFVTSVTHSRRAIFTLEDHAELFLAILLGCRDEGKFQLYAFVLMPEHFHLLVTPADSLSLERCIQFLKGRFSYRLNSRFPVWQPSFTNHRVRDEADFQSHLEYIHSNPVKRGLAKTPAEYPFSSANPRFQLNVPS